MKLYYKPGACSLASHIALIETGESFEIEKVDTKAGKTETGDDYRRINPNGYVPALRLDSGDVLTEGPAILQFIADTHPKARLAPEGGTVDRARVDSYLSFVGSELHKAFSPLFADPAPQGAARETAVTKIGKLFDYIESVFSDGRNFLTGETFTIADAYLFVVSNWSNFVGVDISKWPNTAAFVARVTARPAVQTAMAAENLLKKSA